MVGMQDRLAGESEEDWIGRWEQFTAMASISLEDFDNLINLLYKKEKGIIIISHNLRLCSKYSNRIVNGHYGFTG